MIFSNHTPFPALGFEGIDQSDETLFVIALRQTLSFKTGRLDYAESQEPLREVDSGFDDSLEIREESDLCLFKPFCDVVVNGTAYAPSNFAMRTFRVRLTVRAASSSAGPNDAFSLGAARALIDKELKVYGPSVFKRKSLSGRIFATVIGWCTVGIVSGTKWTRTISDPISSLPMRNEYAFGGEIRIERQDSAFARVPRRYKDAQERSICQTGVVMSHLHVIYDKNPLGHGFTRRWALQATQTSEVRAPQLEWPGRPHTAVWFENVLASDEDESEFTEAIAALGIRPKIDPARSLLLGCVDNDFLCNGAALPRGFDFSYFNAAQPDQQIPWPTGGEVFELTNLCPPDTLGLVRDQNGNQVFSFRLPAVQCFALLRLENGKICAEDLVIDTVVIEPCIHKVSLVWRSTIKVSKAKIRKCEIRMRTHEQLDSQKGRACDSSALPHSDADVARVSDS